MAKIGMCMFCGDYLSMRESHLVRGTMGEQLELCRHCLELAGAITEEDEDDESY